MKHISERLAPGILALAGALNGCSYLERKFPTTPPLPVAVAPAAQPAPAQVNPTLANTAWVAFAIDGVAEVLAPKPALRWQDGEHISGTGGCNLFTARARRNQDALRISSLTPDGKPCLALPGSQEDLFFKALEQTRSFRIEQEQSQLVLEDESGHVLARFLRAN